MGHRPLLAPNAALLAVAMAFGAVLGYLASGSGRPSSASLSKQCLSQWQRGSGANQTHLLDPEPAAEPRGGGSGGGGVRLLEVAAWKLENRSLGLNHAIDTLGGQCHHAGAPGTMQFSANRAWPATAGDARVALVMAVDEVQTRFYNRLPPRFGSWRENFLSEVHPHTVTILLLDANYSSGTAEAAERLGLARADCGGGAAAGCKTLETLDQGYEAYTAALPGGRSSLVLIGVAAFPTPFWVLRRGANESQLLAEGWHTSYCGAEGYNYYKTASWPRYPMLRLALLDFFDFFLKVDDDVSFPKRFPLPDLNAKLAAEQALFMQTGDGWDSPECQGGEGEFLRGYLDTESERCGRLIRAAGEHTTWYQVTDEYMWQGNFVAGWLGLFTSPELLAFAQRFHNDPGSYRNRWQEQGFWPAALAIFHDGSKIMDLAYMRNEKYFCHKDECNQTSSEPAAPETDGQ